MVYFIVSPACLITNISHFPSKIKQKLANASKSKHKQASHPRSNRASKIHVKREIPSPGVKSVTIGDFGCFGGVTFGGAGFLENSWPEPCAFRAMVYFIVPPSCLITNISHFPSKIQQKLATASKRTQEPWASQLFWPGPLRLSNAKIKWTSMKWESRVGGIIAHADV